MLFQFQQGVIRRFLLRPLLGVACAGPVDLISDAHGSPEGFVMIRPFLPQQAVGHPLIPESGLHNLLKDSLAIEKELLILQVAEYHLVDKLFRASKTTIHIDRADQRLQSV